MVTGYGMNTWLSVKTLGVVYMLFGDSLVCLDIRLCIRVSVHVCCFSNLL